jgi:hypothetical protein
LGIEHIARQFLSDLTLTPTLPDNSTSVVQHHELSENKKFLGRPSRTRLPYVVIAAILHQRYCLVPCNIDPDGYFGPLSSSLLWLSKRHLAAILSLSRNRFIRASPPVRLPADAAASLASASLQPLVQLPADTAASIA